MSSISHQKKPIVVTESGTVLTLAPGTENPLPADEWLKKIEEWRKNNPELLVKISVEEFLADKHAQNQK